MTSRRAAVLLAALCVLVSVAPPTAAQTADEPTFLDKLLGLEDAEEIDTLSEVIATAEGNAAKARLMPGKVVQSPDPEAELDSAASFFNTHSDEFQAAANGNVEATPEHNVVKIRAVVGDETATRYLIARVEDGEYRNVRVAETNRRDIEYYVEDGDRFVVQYTDGPIDTVDSLNHSVDDTVTVRGWAVAYIDDELEEFHQRFVADEDQQVTREYLARHVVAFGSQVENTLTGGS